MEIENTGVHNETVNIRSREQLNQKAGCTHRKVVERHLLCRQVGIIHHPAELTDSPT